MQHTFWEKCCVDLVLNTRSQELEWQSINFDTSPPPQSRYNVVGCDYFEANCVVEPEARRCSQHWCQSTSLPLNLHQTKATMCADRNFALMKMR